MSEFEKKQIEQDFKNFTKRNFEKPKKCKNLGQAKYYANELDSKISELKRSFNYVPKSAYTLLDQYNIVQQRMRL